MKFLNSLLYDTRKVRKNKKNINVHQSDKYAVVIRVNSLSRAYKLIEDCKELLVSTEQDRDAENISILSDDVALLYFFFYNATMYCRKVDTY